MYNERSGPGSCGNRVQLVQGLSTTLLILTDLCLLAFRQHPYHDLFMIAFVGHIAQARNILSCAVPT